MTALIPIPQGAVFQKNGHPVTTSLIVAEVSERLCAQPKEV